MVIPRGSVVSLQADVTINGGAPKLVCDFFDVLQPLESVRVIASTVFSGEPMEDSLFALCRAPDSASKYALRLAVLVTGPAELRMGVVRISSYEPLS
jgi:hypothetical protein